MKRRSWVHAGVWTLTVLTVLTVLTSASAAEPGAEGQSIFESHCPVCHGADGNGGELGPAIAARVTLLNDQQIKKTVLEGLPARGMPPQAVSEPDLAKLLVYLRTLRTHPVEFKPHPLTAQLTDGQRLEGMVLAEGVDDIQLRGSDGQLHLLRRGDGTRLREVTSTVDWTTYNGDAGGNRLTSLRQITGRNVRQVAPRWSFTLPNASRLEVTPVVSRGVMYVTNGNECYALDAGTGRPIWHFQRPRTPSLIGNAAGGINRGVAAAGDRIFMVMDDAHLVALNRADGTVAWDTQLADWHQNYNATSAPLTVGRLVITGTAGGEEGVRGFVAAYDQATGREVWRFWTVPLPSEPAAATWNGKGIAHGGAVAWFTGVYDAETDTIFWPTGNPGNDYNGDERQGDNLYADCILALDATTGRMKWYYQTTPHDVWDWDASETPLVIDADWHGRRRQLLVQGNRNGFFYVFDRTNGELLLARQFIDELTWATGIGADGRPVKRPDADPTEMGTRVCPAQSGATNWYSPSYSPRTGLFYMQTNERCSIIFKRANEFRYGQPFLGGAPQNVESPPPRRILRALDLQTGIVKWQTSQQGTATSSGGTLATGTDLVFFADDSGAFAATDAKTGRRLWSFNTGTSWRASPMAYEFDGKEMLGIAVGGGVFAFGLPD